MSKQGVESREQSLADRMRAKGLRLTAQRRILADLLDSAEEHLDAEAVYILARKKDPSINRATVERTLSKLKKLGLVDELDLMQAPGDRHFYEIRPSVVHIHLVCMKCGKVQQPSGPFWEELRARVRRETGFHAEMIRVEMGGLCEDCRAERAAQAD